MEESIINLIFKLQRCMKDKNSFDHADTLSILQVQVLVFLARKKEPVRMSDIAQEFSIELPSATSLINKLVALDLVRREASDEDRRLVTVSLTQSAKGMLTKVWKKKTARIKENLGCLSENDKKELKRILTILVEYSDTTHEK